MSVILNAQKLLDFICTNVMRTERSETYRGTTNSESNTGAYTDNASSEDLCSVRWRVCRTNVGTHGNEREDQVRWASAIQVDKGSNHQWRDTSEKRVCRREIAGCLMRNSIGCSNGTKCSGNHAGADYS